MDEGIGMRDQENIVAAIYTGSASLEDLKLKKAASQRNTERTREYFEEIPSDSESPC